MLKCSILSSSLLVTAGVLKRSIIKKKKIYAGNAASPFSKPRMGRRPPWFCTVSAEGLPFPAFSVLAPQDVLKAIRFLLSPPPLSPL